MSLGFRRLPHASPLSKRWDSTAPSIKSKSPTLPSRAPQAKPNAALPTNQDRRLLSPSLQHPHHPVKVLQAGGPAYASFALLRVPRSSSAWAGLFFAILRGRENSEAFSCPCRPPRLDFHTTMFSRQIVPETRPRPMLRAIHECTRHGVAMNIAQLLRLSGVAMLPAIGPPGSRRSISASGENPTRLTRFKNNPAQAELGRGTLEFCERRVGRGHRPKCSADARPRLLTFLGNDLGSSVISQGTPRDTSWLVRYACDSLRPVSVLIVLIGVLHDIVRRYSSAFGLLLCRDRLPLAVKGNGHA